jgi:hypothetical protein
MPQFKYEIERRPGMGTWYRWYCPKCGRRGDLQLDREFAKKDARESHGYGRCPEGSR